MPATPSSGAQRRGDKGECASRRPYGNTAGAFGGEIVVHAYEPTCLSGHSSLPEPDLRPHCFRRAVLNLQKLQSQPRVHNRNPAESLEPCSESWFEALRRDRTDPREPRYSRSVALLDCIGKLGGDGTVNSEVWLVAQRQRAMDRAGAELGSRRGLLDGASPARAAGGGRAAPWNPRLESDRRRPSPIPQ